MNVCVCTDILEAQYVALQTPDQKYKTLSNYHNEKQEKVQIPEEHTDTRIHVETIAHTIPPQVFLLPSRKGPSSWAPLPPKLRTRATWSQKKKHHTL